MAKPKVAPTHPVEEDVARMKGWFSSLLAPIATFVEGRFIWLAVLPIGFWAWHDRALLKTWLGLILAVVLLTALGWQLRKIVFLAEKYGKLEDYALAALKEPVAAALVFLGCVAFMIAVLLVGALWLGGMRG